jgi:hypothetical protein
VGSRSDHNFYIIDLGFVDGGIGILKPSDQRWTAKHCWVIWAELELPSFLV